MNLRLADLRIGTRLGLCFALLLAAMAALILVAQQQFGHADLLNKQLIEEDWVKAEATQIISATTRANARRTMELLIVTDPARVAKIKERIEFNKKTISDAIATLERLVSLPEGKAALADLKAARARYVASFSQVVQMVDQGQREEATRRVDDETLPLLDAMQKPVDQLTALQRKVVLESGEELSEGIASGRRWMLGLGAAAMLAGLVLALWITRTITAPLGQAVAVAREVAEGRLDTGVRVDRRDECGELLKGLNDMSDSLVRVVQRVRQSADSTAQATRQIAAGNQDLSSRTEQQASALEQTAASMEQLSANVKLNHESAMNATRLAGDAAQLATRGGEVVGKLVDTMERISESSRRITDIIGVIDGIAFQTNILALNAAVEAARAGEQGRGFAVVAGEVRQLAQRSAEAAREIKALIGRSSGTVEDGSRLVSETGGTMGQIVTQVNRVAQLISEISHASQEQSAGLEQINEAIVQMDQVTQQNAALVEEAAAAAQSLEHQARGLVDLVSVFRFKER